MHNTLSTHHKDSFSNGSAIIIVTTIIIANAAISQQLRMKSNMKSSETLACLKKTLNIAAYNWLTHRNECGLSVVAVERK